MVANNSTSQVVVSRSGTGWTVDVTSCNLSTDLSLKDFVVLFDSVAQSNTNFTKNSTTLITYTGSSIGTTNVTVRRDTPITRLTEVLYKDRLNSGDYESELNRVHKILTEIDQFGSAATTISVSDLAYNATTWDGVTNVAPSQNAVRDKIQAMVSDTAYGVGWNGVTDVAPSQNAVYDKIETVVSDASYGTAFNGSTLGVSQNALYDHLEASRGLAGNCRLSLSSTDPMPATITGVNTLYLLPYKGNRVAIYDTANTRWKTMTFSSASVSVAAVTANQTYDVYAYDNSGTLAIELLAWSTNTVRATALVLQDGVHVKSGDTSRRYVGTVYVDASNQLATQLTSDGTGAIARWQVFNFLNPISIDISKTDSAGSTYSYTTNTIRAVNNSSAYGFLLTYGLNSPLNLQGSMQVQAVSTNATNDFSYLLSFGDFNSTSTLRAPGRGAMRCITGVSGTTFVNSVAWNQQYDTAAFGTGSFFATEQAAVATNVTVTISPGTIRLIAHYKWG